MVNMGNVWDRTAEFLSDNLASVMPVALLAIFVPTSIMSNLQGLLPNAPVGGKLALLAAILVLALVTGWGAADGDRADARSARRRPLRAARAFAAACIGARVDRARACLRCCC